MKNNSNKINHDSEGVIKFQYKFLSSLPPSQEEVESLINWRKRSLQLGGIGFDSIQKVGYGNISKRISGDTFVVSASQTGHLLNVKPEHFVTMINYDFNTHSAECKGILPPSSESLTHAMIYREFPSINGIIHVHHNGLWEKFKDILPSSSEKTGYGTTGMIKEIERLKNEEELGAKKVLIMKGHQDGIIIFGDTLEEAGKKYTELMLPFIEKRDR